MTRRGFSQWVVIAAIAFAATLSAQQQPFQQDLPAPAPPVDQPTPFKYFGYFHTDGRYGDFTESVRGYTNTYVADLCGYDTGPYDCTNLSELDAAAEQFRISLQRAVAQGKHIFLRLNDDVHDWVVDRSVQEAAPYWSSVKLIEAFHEKSAWSAEMVSNRINAVKAVFTHHGVTAPVGGMGGTYGVIDISPDEGDPPATQGIHAGNLDFVAVEAYRKAFASFLPPPQYNGHAHYMTAKLTEAKQRIVNTTNKKIIWIPMAYDQCCNPTYTNISELIKLQDVPYFQAYNDARVIGLVMFAYGRGEGAGTADHFELQLRHTKQRDGIVPPDFNRNHHPDLVWRNISTGKNRFWFMNGRQRQTATPLDGATDATIESNWEIRAVGDLDGNLVPDVIWHDTTAPAPQPNLAVWLYQDAGLIGGVYLQYRESDPEWKLVAAADLDRDGHVDLLWHNQSPNTQNPNRGQLRVWYMTTDLTRQGDPQPIQAIVNGQPQNAILVPPWEVGGVADMNGDSYPDLVIRYYGTHPSAGVGAIGAWLMQDRIRSSSSLLNPANNIDLDWRLVGVADVALNDARDGKPDLIWQHTRATNNLAIWYMNGLAVLEIGGAAQYYYLNPATEPDPLNWKIVGVK